MGQADGCRYLINVLSAGAAGMENVDFNIFRVDAYINLIGFRQNCYCGGGSVDSAGGFGNGDPLHAMDPSFIFQPAKSTFTLDLEDDFFVAPASAFADIDDIDAPVFLLGVARVHSEKV